MERWVSREAPLLWVLLSSLLVTNTALICFCEEREGERVISLSEKVGAVLDKEESRRWGLYKGVTNFISAIYIQQLDTGRYFAKVSLQEDERIVEKKMEVSPIMINVWGYYITNYEKIQLERQREKLRREREHLIHGAIFAIAASFIAANIIKAWIHGPDRL